MLKNNDFQNIVMNALPDNRPITALQIVEDYEKTPRNFRAVNRTYDQDIDADLWRETSILFKRTTRYLCLSKSEGLADYIIETLKILPEREKPPDGYSSLLRTADTEQKAWRKKQITYKLSKKQLCSQAVTDIIFCSKLKSPPEGFCLAGEVNGLIICYKLEQFQNGQLYSGPIIRSKEFSNDLQNKLHYMNISPKPKFPLPQHENHSCALDNQNDYEEICINYKLPNLMEQSRVPNIPTPKIGQTNNKYLRRESNNSVHDDKIRNTGTLHMHSDIDGVPFMLNPNLYNNNNDTVLINMSKFINANQALNLSYDFQLERQILCTTKTTNVKFKNPFFH